MCLEECDPWVRSHLHRTFRSWWRPAWLSWVVSDLMAYMVTGTASEFCEDPKIMKVIEKNGL